MNALSTGSQAVRMGLRALCAWMFAVSIVQAEMRTWTHVSGRTIEAEYVSTTLSDEAVLVKSDGSQVKIPLKELSDADHEYIALRNPPKLKIEFSDKSKVETLASSDKFQSNPAVTEETVQFKVSIKQAGTKAYPYGLTVEYYAIGYQYLDQDKYVLLDKGKEYFELTAKNGREFECSTKSMKLPMEFTMYINHYGLKYSNFLVLVFDERGELIAHEETKNWLYEYRENLRKLPKGAFFDETCTRQHASQPKTAY